MKEFIEKLIKRLNEKSKWVAYGNRDRDIGMTHKVVPFSDISDIVNELAEEFATDINVGNKDGWIPCSERLPQEPFGCLVTIMDCEPMTQTDFENILNYHVGYDGETWNDADGNAIPFEVVAWQPLPAPYKEGCE